MNIPERIGRTTSPDLQPEPVVINRPAARRGPDVGTGGSSTVVGDLKLLLSRNYKLLALTSILGLIAAYLYTGSEVPQYRATATLEIQDLNENFLNKEVSQVSPFASTTAINDMQTHLRILQSGTLLTRTLQNLPAEKIPPTPGLAGLIVRILPKSLPSTAPSIDTQLDHAAQNLQVRETRQARIVDVTYESPDPAYATAFANGLVQRYIDQSIEARLQISQGTSQWLEKQLAEAGSKMAASENTLQDYARKSGLLVTTENKRPDEEKFRQIQESLTKAQENRMVKQARMETAAAAPLNSLDIPLGSALHEFQTKLADLRRQRADLITVFTPDYDGVKRLDSQIAALESAQKNESNAILQAIKNDYTDALKRERLLEQSYQEQFLKVTEQSGIAIQYGILKRAVDTNRDLYNTLLQRTAEAKIATALRASGARVVDPARVPRLPFKPSRILNLLWGMTAGALFGLLVITARTGSVHPTQGARDLAVKLGIPELGTVPRITMVGSANAAQRWGVEAGFVRIPGQDPSTADGVAMTTWNNRTSREANSFRSILTSILLSRITTRTPQMIVVTSAGAQEGKTTVVANLAAALSQMGRTVLLVDASPDRRLHELFQAARDSGLHDVLELPGENSALLPYVTRETSWNLVSLVSTGNQETNALDLLYAPGMIPILLEMRRNYDVILIDTPALDEHPDARILGRMADGVVLVVQDGEDHLQSATSATARLQEDGTIVLGTVLNKVS